LHACDVAWPIGDRWCKLSSSEHPMQSQYTAAPASTLLAAV